MSQADQDVNKLADLMFKDRGEVKRHYLSIDECLETGRSFNMQYWLGFAEDAGILNANRGRTRSAFRKFMNKLDGDLALSWDLTTRNLIEYMESDFRRSGTNGKYEAIRDAIRTGLEISGLHTWQILNRDASENANFNYIKAFAIAMGERWPNLVPKQPEPKLPEGGFTIQERSHEGDNVTWLAMAHKMASHMNGTQKQLATTELTLYGGLKDTTWHTLCCMVDAHGKSTRKPGMFSRAFVTHALAIELNVPPEALKYLNEYLIHELPLRHGEDLYKSAHKVFNASTNPAHKPPGQYLAQNKPKKYGDVADAMMVGLSDMLGSPSSIDVMKSGDISVGYKCQLIHDEILVVGDGPLDLSSINIQPGDTITMSAIDLRGHTHMTKGEYKVTAPAMGQTNIVGNNMSGNNSCIDTSKPVRKLTEVFGQIIGENTPTEVIMDMIRKGQATIESLQDLKNTGRTIACRIDKIESSIETLTKELNRKGRC